MSLLPKEHGAYGQMAFPLVTAMLVSGVSMGSLLFAIAVVAGFVLHEPLLVLLGLRGPRAKREQGGAAVRWVVALAILVIITGTAALRWMEPAHRISVALPLVPALFIFIAAASGKGKSIGAEIAVAIAFSLTAVPLCLLGGQSIVAGAAIALAFASNFVLATLAVRVVIARVRGGGDPRLAAAMRRSAYVTAGAIAAGAAVAAGRGLVPWLPLSAIVPGIVAAIWIATFPPHPSRLKAVGWTLVTLSALVTVLLVVTLRIQP
jgi:hypothetical protein